MKTKNKSRFLVFFFYLHNTFSNKILTIFSEHIVFLILKIDKDKKILTIKFLIKNNYFSLYFFSNDSPLYFHKFHQISSRLRFR